MRPDGCLTHVSHCSINDSDLISYPHERDDGQRALDQRVAPITYHIVKCPCASVRMGPFVAVSLSIIPLSLYITHFSSAEGSGSVSTAASNSSATSCSFSKSSSGRVRVGRGQYVRREGQSAGNG